MRGKIHCSRTVAFVSFLQLTLSTQPRRASDQKFTDHCNQTECNVVSFMKANKRVCNGELLQGINIVHNLTLFLVVLITKS